MTDADKKLYDKAVDDLWSIASGTPEEIDAMTTPWIAGYRKGIEEMKKTCGTCYGYNPKSVCELCRHKEGAACAEWKPKKTCGNCICYLDDTDENGNVTNYHHDKRR